MKPSLVSRSVGSLPQCRAPCEGPVIKPLKPGSSGNIDNILTILYDLPEVDISSFPNMLIESQLMMIRLWETINIVLIDCIMIKPIINPFS